MSRILWVAWKRSPTDLTNITNNAPPEQRENEATHVRTAPVFHQKQDVLQRMQIYTKKSEQMFKVKLKKTFPPRSLRWDRES